MLSATVISSAPLLQRPRGFENLFRPRGLKEILCHHAPANCTRGIEQELSRTRNVFPARKLFGVNQIITANCLGFWIREKSKGVSSFLEHILASFLGRINADTYHTDPGVDKLVHILLETPQLGLTHSSPITSVKNQEDGSWGFVVNWLSQQLT